MPLPICVDHTSASHRPTPFLLASLLLSRMQSAALNGTELGEPAPSDATVRNAINLIAEIPARLLGQPEVNPFYGEVHVSWQSGGKQVILMVFPNRTPLVHHYPEDEHSIEVASAERLTHWLNWLRH